jgi:monovalent cation:H+ antiporter-2, CPA2 family
MIHLPNLIQDLGFILGTAAVVTLVFRFLKQPVVLGYLIAGLLVGPHVTFMPSITETESVKVWAEIGVIFLLFGLGLEFSFKKLSSVGKSASITALFEIIFMLGLGYLTGQILGWSKMDSLFLGGILSISSTTIIVRAFDELNMKGRRFVSLVFGVLIVEDLVAILLLVLLSSVAVSQTFEGTELIASSLRLGFFMVLWFVMGIYLIPILLQKIRHQLSNETMLIVSISLCLMMVLIAANVGFSPALGAFIMGSLLAETRDGHRIEKLIVPVRDLFGAVFFVSVGMMIDPKILSEYFWVILLMTFITIVGKLLSTTVGALVSGRSLKNSVQAGMSLAQIGEFSFIIATLGLTLKVTSDFLYPIAVAVSAITTFTTPYLIKYADPFYFWIENKLSPGLKQRLDRYETAMSSSSGDNMFTLIWSEYGIKILLNSVVVIALALTMSRLALPQIEKAWFDWLDSSWISSIVCLGTIILTGPFLWAVVMSRARHTVVYHPQTLIRLRRLQFSIAFLRYAIGVGLAAFVVGQFASLTVLPAIILLAFSTIGVYFSSYAEPLYKKVESRFLDNLTANERDELEKRPSTPELAPWSATLSEFVVSPHSEVIAKTLHESALKEKFGITVTMIERGDKKILAPNRFELLLPYDRVFVIGTEEQLIALKSYLEVQITQPAQSETAAFGLDSILLRSSSDYINKPIRDCGLREKVEGLIVGIERDGQRILNPDSGLSLKENDLLWVVGNLTKLKQLKTS